MARLVGFVRSGGWKRLLLWAGLGVSALFAYLSVRGVHWGEVSHALRTSHYVWLVPSFAVLAVAVLVRGLRWRYLFVRETRPPFGPVMASLLVAYFFNNVLPARAGEAARVVALNQRAGTSRAEAAATVVVERAFDVLSLLVLLFVGLPWFPHVTWLKAAVAVAIGLVAGMLAAIVVLARWGERPLRFALRPAARLPFFSGERVEWAAANLAQGAAGLRRPRLAAAAFAWTTLSWLLVAVSMWLTMRAFDLGLSPAAGLLVVVAVNLAMILPSSPAAVGVFEAATLVALKAYGISDSRALSYALVLHALHFVPYLVIGFLVLHVHASSLRRAPRRAKGLGPVS